MYLPHEIQLRVCNEQLQRNAAKAKMQNTRIILLQHLLRDTEHFINLLAETGAEIFCILGKPFSLDVDVKTRLEMTYRVEVHPYEKYDNTTYLDDLVLEAHECSKVDGKPILILEVGGYFAKPLTRISSMVMDTLKGVVEVTTFGHNKYIANITNIEVPVFSVARSSIKEIEACYVAEAAAIASNSILRELGVSFPGREALVIGYGMIGRNVAEALHAHKLRVSVYDSSHLAQLKAFIKGYKIGERDDLISSAAIIFSATAAQSMSYADILKCKDNAVLVSAGSRGGEFDVEGIKENSISQTSISANITKFKLSSRKNIFLVRNGTAVNFYIKSCPDEIVDLIHAEVISCALKMLGNCDGIPIHMVNESCTEVLNNISKDWIKHTA